MWDEELVARIKERKTGELMMYAGLVKYDPANRGAYLDVIDILGRQLDACDLLLGGCEDKPEAEMLVNPGYRGRLSESEMSDETVFNTYIVRPVNPGDGDLSEHMLDLIDKANQFKDYREAQGEAMKSLKDELASCRSRIDMLASKLEFVQEENSALTEENAELKEQLESVSARAASPAEPVLPDMSWVDTELEPISDLLDQVVESQSEDPEFYLSRLAEAKQTLAQILFHLGTDISECGLEALDETLGKVYVLKASVDITDLLLRSQENAAPIPVEAAEPPAVEDGFYEQILTEDELQLLRMVRDMKNSKIDYFVDMAMSGRFNENACDDVIDFLKVDLSIIKDLLSMDYHDRQSIEDNFNDILNVLGDASEPKHQKMYVNSLTGQEKVMEDTYNRIIERVQTIMLARYSEAEE